MAWNDYVSKVMSPSSNWWDKKLSDKQRFQLQAPQDVGLLDVASAVPTPVGDVASGLLAAQDVSKGNYGSAALNALGLLPFIPSMGAIVKNTDTFEQLAKTGKIRQAKNKEQELNDLISGKSKFAEVRLNWDDPKTYDLADKLKAQGFDSTVIQQGKDMVTLFHKSAEDVSPVLNAKTPYDFGKAYGYSDNDIAAFYNNRYGKDAEKYWQKDSKFLPAKTEFEVKQITAQKNAALPINEGGLGLPSNNTAMDRAKALGFDDKTYYHGTNADIKAFDPEKSAMGGITWIAETPKYANDFTTNSSLGSGNILPLKAKMGKTAGWKEYDQLGLDELTGRGYESTWLPEKNAESVGFVFNPNQLRSTNAAFDPFRRNEADILAGVAPLAAGSLLGLSTYNNMQEKPKKEKKKSK